MSALESHYSSQITLRAELSLTRTVKELHCMKAVRSLFARRLAPALLTAHGLRLRRSLHEYHARSVFCVLPAYFRAKERLLAVCLLLIKLSALSIGNYCSLHVGAEFLLFRRFVQREKTTCTSRLPRSGNDPQTN